VTPIIPYLLYEDAAAAIAFLTRAFGFTELNRTLTEAGRIKNCELAGPAGGEVWLGEVDSVEGSSLVWVYVEDADAHCEHARAEGAEITMEPIDRPFGDRQYEARDPQGHRWFFAHPISEDSPARRS
jgi:uncharacterized glyoxalase superfamily protein PhnB